MVDNVAITAGTGTNVATDDIASVHYQRVKLSLGADGTAVDAGAGAGAVGTDTQRVTLGSDDPAVATLGAVADAAATAGGTGSLSAKLRLLTTDIDAIKTAVQIMDDWDETNRAAVNLISGQVGVAGGSGVNGATVQRVTVATDDTVATDLTAIKTAAEIIDNATFVDDADWTALTSSHFLVGGVYQSSPGSITDGDTGPLRVTVNGAAHVAIQGSLPAGTAAIGKLAANSGVDIGDVDILSIAAGTNEIGQVRSQTSDTGTASQVADSATSVTILAANADRRGASIANDSSAVLYLLVGTGTASSSNYTVRMVQYGYYEVPAGYTGIISGIWASDPNDGGAKVTEWDNA